MHVLKATSASALVLLFNHFCPLKAHAEAPAKSLMPCKITLTEEKTGPQTFEVAQAVINAPSEKVQEVLYDYASAPTVFENVKKCRVVSSNGTVKNVAFTVSNSSHAWTFDYVLELKETPGLIEWHRVQGAFKRNDGYWRLQPIDNDRATLVTYAKCIEGGLLIPQSLIRREVRATMPTTLSELKQAAESASKVAQVTELARL